MLMKQRKGLMLLPTYIIPHVYLVVSSSFLNTRLFSSLNIPTWQIWKYDSEQKHQHHIIWDDFWSELRTPCQPTKYMKYISIFEAMQSSESSLKYEPIYLLTVWHKKIDKLGDKRKFLIHVGWVSTNVTRTRYPHAKKNKKCIWTLTLHHKDYM